MPEQSMVREPSLPPEPEDVPIPSVDDLVIENLTDQTIDFDESSTDELEIFAVTGGDKKRVEDNERKMTDGDRNSFAEQRRQCCSRGWIKVFDIVNKKVAGGARWVLTWKSSAKAFQDSDLTEVPRDSSTLSGPLI